VPESGFERSKRRVDELAAACRRICGDQNESEWAKQRIQQLLSSPASRNSVAAIKEAQANLADDIDECYRRVFAADRPKLHDRTFRAFSHPFIRYAQKLGGGLAQNLRGVLSSEEEWALVLNFGVPSYVVDRILPDTSLISPGFLDAQPDVKAIEELSGEWEQFTQERWHFFAQAEKQKFSARVYERIVFGPRDVDNWVSLTAQLIAAIGAKLRRWKADFAQQATEQDSSFQLEARRKVKAEQTEAGADNLPAADRRAGRKADVALNSSVVRVLRQYGADWREKLDDVCHELSHMKVPLPVSRKWRDRGCADWLDVLAEDKEGLVKALQHRLDWASRNHSETK